MRHAPILEGLSEREVMVRRARGQGNSTLPQIWTGGSALSGDWRPTLLALGMLVVFLIMVAIPWVRAFFSLAALDSRAYILIGVAAILWALLQRWLWRIHFLERFLALEEWLAQHELYGMCSPSAWKWITIHFSLPPARSERR